MFPFTLLIVLSVMTTPTQAQLLPLPIGSTPRGALDTTLVNRAARMVEHSAAIALLWPGFWKSDQSFMVVGKTGDVHLISGRSAPVGYERVSAIGLPRSLVGRLYRPVAPPADLKPGRYSIGYMVGPDTIPALGFEGGDLGNQFGFYFHEAFHGFQKMRWSTTPFDGFMARFKEPLVPNGANDTPEFVLLAEAERRMLVAAIRATSADSTSASIRRYLAVRRARTRNNATIDGVERRFERSEGTAELIRCQVEATILDDLPARTRNCIQRRLEQPFEESPAGGESDARLMRWRLYGTGAAIAFVLDKLHVENWRTRVTDGEALDIILARAVGMPGQ